MEWKTIKCTITTDIFNRIATNFNYKINELKSTIFIVSDDRLANAKSLLGLLSLQLRTGDIIEIRFDDSEETSKIKEIISEIAEIKEG